MADMTGRDYLDERYGTDTMGDLLAIVAEQDADFIDGPTVEQWHRELEMVERERDYREEMREAQIAKTWDPSTWGGDEFPF